MTKEYKCPYCKRVRTKPDDTIISICVCGEEMKEVKEVFEE